MTTLAFWDPRRVAGAAAISLRRWARRSSLPSQPWWLSVRFSSSVGEIPVPQRDRATPEGLLPLLELLERAACDPCVEGLSFALSAEGMGFGTASTLRRSIERVRSQGKPIVVYAEVLDATSLLVASGATQVWLPETGRVFLVGVRAQGLYVREALDRLGVKPEVVRVGTHKSAGEMFTRDEMSTEQREQLEDLTEDRFETLVEGIARGRGLPDETVRTLIDEGPYTAKAAVAAGLVDACVYPDDVATRLRALSPVRAGAPRAVMQVPARTYQAVSASGTVSAVPALAYVVCEGSISRGVNTRGIGSDGVAQLLRALGDDPDVLGVLLRIDSPGGDALASDLLWREIRELRRLKPVVASLGEVAASGGYYMACAADAIFAESPSVTGSIGVIGGKLNIEGLLGRLGVSTDGVERGARAGLLAPDRGFTSNERRAVRDEMQSLYEIFLERVAEGRGLSTKAVHGLAEGRVYSARRAKAAGLIDTLGGPLEAMAALKRLAGVRDHEPVRCDVYPKSSFASALRPFARWFGQ